MKKFIIVADLVFLIFTGIMFFTTGKQTRILFIGNSYTYRNEMPDLFEHIAISMGKNVYVQSVTKGKATLQIQSQREDVYRAINDHQWDYVVIQGSSRDFIQRKETIEEKTLPALEKVIREVRRNRADTKILFYMTWGYRNGFVPLDHTDTFEKMTAAVRDEYIRLGKFYNFGVVPVGMAFLDSRIRRPKENLYVADGAHPSLKGSYLAACCFYSAIYNESSIGSIYYSKLGPKICYYLQSVGSKNVLYQRKKYNLIGKEVKAK